MTIAALGIYAATIIAIIMLCGFAHVGQLALESWDYRRHVND